jgi:hypothetical protein
VVRHKSLLLALAVMVLSENRASVRPKRSLNSKGEPSSQNSSGIQMVSRHLHATGFGLAPVPVMMSLFVHWSFAQTLGLADFIHTA